MQDPKNPECIRFRELQCPARKGNFGPRCLLAHVVRLIEFVDFTGQPLLNEHSKAAHLSGTASVSKVIGQQEFCLLRALMIGDAVALTDSPSPGHHVLSSFHKGSPAVLCRYLSGDGDECWEAVLRGGLVHRKRLILSVTPFVVTHTIDHVRTLASSPHS